MIAIALDAGPLARIVCHRANPTNRACLDRARSWLAAGHRVIVPGLADYEARRLLGRSGASGAIARLDRLAAIFEPGPATGAAMRHAASLWAEVRRDDPGGWSPDAIDADAILAAQAIAAAGPGAEVVIACDHIGDLGRFVAARHWFEIDP